MISSERISFALELLERLEKSKKTNCSIEDARRRLRILEVLSK